MDFIGIKLNYTTTGESTFIDYIFENFVCKTNGDVKEIVRSIHDRIANKCKIGEEIIKKTNFCRTCGDKNDGDQSMYCDKCLIDSCDSCEYYTYVKNSNVLSYKIVLCDTCFAKKMYEYKCSCGLDYGNICKELDEDSIPGKIYKFGNSSIYGDIEFYRAELNINDDVIYQVSSSKR